MVWCGGVAVHRVRRAQRLGWLMQGASRLSDTGAVDDQWNLGEAAFCRLGRDQRFAECCNDGFILAWEGLISLDDRCLMPVGRDLQFFQLDDDWSRPVDA